MPIDVSIYQNYLKPPKSIAEYGAEMDAADQNRMALESGRMNLLAAKQAQADEQAVRAAYQKPGFDPQSDAGIMELMRLNPKAGFSAAEARQKALKAQADLGHVGAQTEKERLSGAKQQIDLVLQAVSAAKDPQSYAQALQFLQANGIKTDGAPAQYDPAAIANFGQMAQTAAQRLEQVWKQKGYDLDVRKQTEVERNNTTQNRISQGNLKVAQDRLANDKEAGSQAVTYQTDADGNMVAVPSRIAPGSAVRAIPVMAPGGVQPLQGKGAGLTEDQGKATGWLVQANNAWKNMQAAVEVDPSAAKPGFNDALAGIPSFGLTEGIANSMRSPERQKFMQGASSLSEALLRAATGAGVNADEARQKVRELTPVWGEDESTTAQKMSAIPTYIESLKVRAGPGAKKADAIGNTTGAVIDFGSLK